eukprot:351625-Chlamydomonas_euryale.AAC.7
MESPESPTPCGVIGEATARSEVHAHLLPRQSRRLAAAFASQLRERGTETLGCASGGMPASGRLGCGGEAHMLCVREDLPPGRCSVSSVPLWRVRAQPWRTQAFSRTLAKHGYMLPGHRCAKALHGGPPGSAHALGPPSSRDSPPVATCVLSP